MRKRNDIMRGEGRGLMRKLLLGLMMTFAVTVAVAEGKVDIDVLPAKDPQGLNKGVSQKGLNKIGKAIENDVKAVKSRSVASNAKVQKKKKTLEAVFNPLENSGKYTFTDGEVEFHTSWSTCGQHSYYAYGGTTEKDENRVGYKAGYGKLPDNPNRYENELDFSSRCHSVNEGETVVYMNNSPKRFCAIKILKANRDDMGRGKPSLKVRYRIY